ncbi:hypothetical protein EYF80_028129 [Liparis tanakae]|uniref:Uncharacterized protein n=1 Tax=Liparis tanakae TaxID=230148 RepID=A0A4Z2H9S5_9TELE|nr:hypothetical protein EYF80_028129 [Liparis tanakae]
MVSNQNQNAQRLTLSETVDPSLSRALWSTVSLRLDALGRDSFTAWSTIPAGDCICMNMFLMR